MNFDLQDNWSDVPQYSGKNIVWSKNSSSTETIVYKTSVNHQDWNIRMNDFPDEPLYTLIINGKEIIHFNDWPSTWSK